MKPDYSEQAAAVLATVLSDPAVLDRARHDVKKTLSDLLTLA
jgi:hypothetical protein